MRALVFLAVIATLGCAPKVLRLYDGEPRPASAVATLTLFAVGEDDGSGGTTLPRVDFRSCDDKPVPFFPVPETLEFLPGAHSCKVQCVLSRTTSTATAGTPTLTVSFVARANQKLRTVARYGFSRCGVRIEEGR